MAGGGFRPSLKRVSDGVGPEASFLASEHRMAKRAGITVAASTVGADADGNKILRAGTVMAEITAAGATLGKFRAYDNSLAADAGGVAVGFLWETINLRDGDIICGLLLHGSVLAARVSGLDSNARTDLAGRIVFQ